MNPDDNPAPSPVTVHPDQATVDDLVNGRVDPDLPIWPTTARGVLIAQAVNRAAEIGRLTTQQHQLQGELNDLTERAEAAAASRDDIIDTLRYLES